MDLTHAVCLIGLCLICCLIASPAVSAGDVVTVEKTTTTLELSGSSGITDPVSEVIESEGVNIPSEPVKSLKIKTQSITFNNVKVTLKNDGTLKIPYNDLISKYNTINVESRIRDKHKNLLDILIDIPDPNTLSKGEEVIINIPRDGAKETNMYFDEYWLIIKTR